VKKRIGIGLLVALSSQLLMIAVFAAPPAGASSATFTLDIPSQSLNDALQALALASRHKLLYSSELVDGKTSPALKGRFTTEEAVKRLLTGTDLKYEVTADGLVLIGVADAATAAPKDPPGGAKNESQKEAGKKSSQDFRLAQPDQTSPGTRLERGGEQSTQQPALEEIVVSAQKRPERLQDTPLSVSTISGEKLAQYNAAQLSDYAATIPGLQVDSGGAPGFARITLRGISTGDLFGTPTTAIYIGDVPTGSSSNYVIGGAFGIDLLPYDLDHLEVLRGPQGTLYGASSMGGLLKYVLTTPNLTNTSFRASVGGSDIEHGRTAGNDLRGYANIVVVPGELAVSLSGAHSYVPGFINNSATGEQAINGGTQGGGRLAVLWEPYERLSINLSALLNYSNFNALGQIQVTPGGQPVYGKYTAYLPAGNGLQTRTELYSADIHFDFGLAKLTSVTGYSRARSHWRSDSSTFAFFQSLGVLAPFLDVQTVHKFSQELRLSSRDNQVLQWTVGGFYDHENASQFEEGHALDPVTKQPDALYDPLDNVSSPSTFEESAAFGNATYRLLANWDINAGVRYSHNRQSVITLGQNPNGSAGYLFCSDADCMNGNTAPYSTPSFKSSQGVTTYSAGSRYHVGADSMLYVRVASGYRPGGSNQGVEGAPATYRSDRLTSYEIGIKSELLDRKVLVDADVFYVDWSNIQILEYTDQHLTFTGNAATAFSKGVEVTTRYVITRDFRLGGSVTFDDARLTSNAPRVGGADGDQLPLTPRWSAAVTADWSHPITEMYTATAGVVWRYVGERFGDFPQGANYFRFGSYASVDLSAGVTNGHWTLNAFARNIADRYAYLRYNQGYATTLQPRTVGLSLDVAF